MGKRALVGQPYLRDPELRQAYATDIAPRTEVALAKILRELFGSAPAGGTPPRVLDLGAGTGAAGRAIRRFFGAETELVSVDRVAAAGIVVADVGAPGPLRGVDGRFDLIVAAHLLNELFVALPATARIAARAQKARAWCETLLAPGGTMVILEPALRETSRDLLAVRDQLVGAGLRVVAPCLWAGPCPALARERDWCHDAALEPVEIAGQRATTGRFQLPRAPQDRRDDRRPDAVSPPPTPRSTASSAIPWSKRAASASSAAALPVAIRWCASTATARPPTRRSTELARGDLIRVQGATLAADGERIGAESTVENLTRRPPGGRPPSR